jgi:hypothetical protein
VKDMVEWHGVEALFRPREYSIFTDSFTVSIAEMILYSLLDQSIKMAGHSLSNMREIGRILFFAPTPWIKSRLDRDRVLPFRHINFGNLGTSHQQVLEKKLPVDPDTLFGMFALIAAALENSTKQKDGPDFTKGVAPRLPDPLQTIVLARFREIDPKRLQNQLDRSRFSQEQKAFIGRWVRKEIHLTN